MRRGLFFILMVVLVLRGLTGTAMASANPLRRGSKAISKTRNQWRMEWILKHGFYCAM